MRTSSLFYAIVASLALTVPAGANDAELAAWSKAFSAWVDVSRNIACPSLQPRIDALTERLGDVQDSFLARHPDYVFPPMIFLTQPFIDCRDGALLVDRAEGLARQVEGMVKH